MQAETVLITGGTSGIGYEFAKLFAKDKFRLIIVAKDKDKLSIIKKKLETTYNAKVEVFQKDLSKRKSACELYKILKKENIKIDILVNNAGFGLYGKFSETNWQEYEQMLDLNMYTLTYLTKLILPQMFKRRKGKILNIASTAAFLPGPFMALYYATKAYLLSFSLALSYELQGTGVTVTALCPGPTKTGFWERAQMPKVKWYRHNIMDAVTVARIGYKGFRKNKKIIIPGACNLFLIKAVSLFSPSFTAGVVKKMQQC